MSFSKLKPWRLLSWRRGRKRMLSSKLGQWSTFTQRCDDRPSLLSSVTWEITFKPSKKSFCETVMTKNAPKDVKMFSIAEKWATGAFDRQHLGAFSFLTIKVWNFFAFSNVIFSKCKGFMIRVGPPKSKNRFSCNVLRSLQGDFLDTLAFLGFLSVSRSVSD